ncbi:uncharacterized protein HGUI_03064 [Hanseniaspora guilliermondii]|uniref:Uncharacterized protein n=1 Tax=Hanseniaspora guilliermondii TaxID=56406 RepID=A0A1L0B311_9ASCO|nr:uncharacterized protein HGUI_03064 [Hanseniaspora guilliermondii]
MVRIKNRYILFELLYPPTECYNTENIIFEHRNPSKPKSVINPKTILYEVRKQIKYYLGDQSLGKANITLQVKYFNNVTSVGILKCSAEYYKTVVLGLSMIQTINNDKQKVIINVVKLSGTINKLQDHSIKRNKELIKRIKFQTRKNNNLGYHYETKTSSELNKFLTEESKEVEVIDDPIEIE